MMTDLAVVTLLLQELGSLRDELRGLRTDLAKRRYTRLSLADQEALTAMLPIIARIVGERLFTVRELVAHAALPGQTTLRSAMASVGNANRCGRLLRRAAGRAIEGLRLECVGVDRDGRLWRIVRANPADCR